MSTSTLVVDAHHLAKQYRIGGKRERYVTLRDTLTNAARSPFGTLRSAFTSPKDYIWALDDVSFQVQRGEVVGIIGRNGAGKSTLLKVLSRITEPTKGFVDVYGRVGSLLEVGTGFHLELTGRENIYLSGAILGMKKTEIDGSFDAIVDFAGVEKFIDTPVKRYSTGMYLRLAFAVAAHLKTEILMVDEVLAVGDASFQKKCLGRLGSVARQGRTVLFVSHNMGAVRSLCERAIVLEGGQVVADGDVGDCIEAYYRSIGAMKRAGDADDDVTARDDGPFGPIEITGAEANTISNSDGFEISSELRVDAGVEGFALACRIDDMQGRAICRLQAGSDDLGFRAANCVQRQTIRVGLPPLWLHPGLYSVDFQAVFSTDFNSGESATSDKFPLDVKGDHSPRLEKTQVDPVLHPTVTWSIAETGAIDLDDREITGL